MQPAPTSSRGAVRVLNASISIAAALDSNRITDSPLLHLLVRVQRDISQDPTSLKNHSRSESKVNDNDLQHVDAFPGGRQNRATGWYLIQHCNNVPVENGSPPQRATWVGQR
jgi:hypothetical protein